MALSNDAVFPQGLRAGNAVTTAAIGTITGTAPTNTVLLFTASASNGSLIQKLGATTRATAAANVLVYWVSPDGGTTKYQVDQLTAASDTVSTTDKATRIDAGWTIQSPMVLAAGESLYVGNTVADPASGWVWRCEGRDM